MKQISLNNNLLTQSIERIDSVTKSVLSSLLMFCVLFPFFVAYFVHNTGLIIVTIISFAFFWIIGILLLRFILWNHFGKEVIIFNPNTIDYYADFNLFKNGHLSIKSSNLNFSILNETEDKGRLLIKSEDGKIETSIRILHSELKPLIVEMEKFQTKD